MATIILSAAGMALGGSIGGSVLGLSSAVLGRAAGAMLGRAVDERLMGAGSAPVETGRVDAFRLNGAAEGAPVARVMGAARLAGQVIWSSRFEETAITSGGGKGARAPRQTETTTLTYSVSLAIALCEGAITGIGRIWADGVEIARDDVALHVYLATEGQMPDPRMEAVEGAGQVPAYRGMAYVVIEDLDLGAYGNRVPQFSFEVFRPAPERSPEEAEDLAHLVRAVALIPGTGEYALATQPVYISAAYGETRAANVNTVQGKADILVSLDHLDAQLPQLESVSLVVSWFGSDLRVGHCAVRPKVEGPSGDADGMPWQVSGLGRADAEIVPRIDDRPVYGGTPTDASVIEAIRALHERGRAVMFYPFILMDQLAGNGLPDPYSTATDQPAFPWRGRITLSVAPGQPGSPDRTAAADAQVAAFFGAAQPDHFARHATGVAYSGPEEWSLRRMILHYAHLCAEAGGVEAFCIGTEMRGVTWIRGTSGFPAVQALRVLAAEVKAILPGAKITYAADWTEYSGYQPEGEGATKLFHLDPLWADPAIDVVGIDNYLPLSDWRDGEDHLDAPWGSATDIGYLTAGVAGGELYDWYYASDAARATQVRTPITDGDGEPWVWRLKDIRGWWSNQHRDRVGGVRQVQPTAWVPGSKPVWFTEIGCAAIDKGTNEPNKFLDPKSSESSLPRFSNGQRDDYVQMQYLRALHRHWSDPDANPVSAVYGGRMVDMTRAHVWAWDARPFPAFPAKVDVWSDGTNYLRGHWLNGRVTSRSLASVVEEICQEAGSAIPDTSMLQGVVRGMLLEETGTARSALQPLMLAHGFDAVERDGALAFRPRTGQPKATIDAETLVVDPEAEAVLTRSRAPEAELTGRVQVAFVEAGADYGTASVEAVMPDDAVPSLSRSSLPLILTRAEGQRIAERWLAEARIARDGARFILPPSAAHLGAGNVVRLGGASWRIDRVEDTGARAVEAVRVEAETYRPHEAQDDLPVSGGSTPPLPVEAVFLDLPLLRGDEAPYAPHVAMTALPWPGATALHSSDVDAAYALAKVVPLPATIGTTLTSLGAASPGLWDRGPALRVRLVQGALSSAGEERVLAGGAVAAIGDGTSDHWEVIQFAEAVLVAPRTYDLRGRLRGQAGTDGFMPDEWPAGSRFVLLDGVPAQWDFPSSHRDSLRHYRWGPAGRAIGDPSWRHRAAAFRGIGLRPYSVCHLRASPGADGLAISWVRRTRIEGDGWSSIEVPLGEDREAYLVRVSRGSTILREAQVTGQGWIYASALQTADGAGPATVSVAQLSDRFGPGPARRLDVTLG